MAEAYEKVLLKKSLQYKEHKFQYGEFWTSRQRQSHPIHYSVSYRASFKPELPSFFITQYLKKKACRVLDPFGGRGTTALQANLEGHYAIHLDINPLSIFLASSRKHIPTYEKIEKILNSPLFSKSELRKPCPESKWDEDLLAFYHKDTLLELKNLKRIFKENNFPELPFIQMIALSRLHGHSPGFFSVYTFPQVSIPAIQQRKNNQKRKILPEYKSIVPRILQKAKRDLSKPLPPFFHEFSAYNQYLLGDARNLSTIQENSIDLVITSPPFLDKVDYRKDNWIRHWFLDIPPSELENITILSSLENWIQFMKEVISSLYRVVKPGGHIVIEVGEVQKGNDVIHLDEWIVQIGEEVGFEWVQTHIQTQKFTKLSNCWKVFNNEKGTNSNRCVTLYKNSFH